MSDEKYCYPDSDVLINKYGIKELEELYKKERRVTAVTITNISLNPVKGNFDLKHLQAIHKAIFSDIYDWAGKLRTVDIAKSNMFCRVQFMQDYSQDIFDRLKNDKYLIGMDKAQAIEKLAEYIGDINALHPFREGNGRTQRQYIFYLAKTTGIYLDFSKANPDKMMKASLDSFQMKHSGFKELFNDIATPIPIQEQENFLKKISKVAYKEFQQLQQHNRIPDRVEEFKCIDKKDYQLENSGSIDKAQWENLLDQNPLPAHDISAPQIDMDRK